MTEPAAPETPEKPSWHLSPGDEVVPHCTMRARLGGGKRFEVFSAWDDRMLTPVVVKVLRPHLLEHRGTQRGLKREIDILGRLDHPNVVRCFGASTTGDRPHLILERVSGRVVSSLIRKEGPLGEDRLLLLGTSLASALHYLHGAGVVHLDIKPSNVIFGRVPTLIDFSLARTLDKASDLAYNVGTTAYMAPEQCDPPRTGQPGLATDIWGLGVTLFHAATGYRAFEEGSKTPTDPLEQRYLQLVTPPAPLPDTISDPLADVILSCLQYEPADRPAPLEVFNALRAIEGEAAMPGATGPTTTRTAPPSAPVDPEQARLRRQFSAALRAKSGRPRTRRPR